MTTNTQNNVLNKLKMVEQARVKMHGLLTSGKIVSDMVKAGHTQASADSIDLFLENLIDANEVVSMLLDEVRLTTLTSVFQAMGETSKTPKPVEKIKKKVKVKSKAEAPLELEEEAPLELEEEAPLEVEPPEPEAMEYPAPEN